MAITSTTGIASGLNIEDIISKMMQIENRSLEKVQAEKAGYEKKISSLGTILNALSSLKSAVTPLKSSTVLGMKATSTDTSVFTAAADSTASAGTYNIKVNSLAQAHSIYSQTYTASTDTVGTGTLSIQVGTGTAVDVTIDTTNNTLDGIKDAINNASAGVNASVINDGTGYRLILTSSSSGAANTINLTVTDDDLNNTDTSGLSALSYTTGAQNMTQSQAGADASLVVDSLTITRSSNKITDIISGITLELKKDSAGSTLSLTVAKDTDALKTKINSFITAYNSAMNSVIGLKGTKSSKGAMYGETLLDSVKTSLRSVTTTTFGTSTLAALGITHDKNLVMSIDTSVLDSALSTDSQNVVDTLNSMGTSFETTMNDYINSFIPSKKSGFNTTVTYLSRKEDNLSYKLDLMETNLGKKFTELEKTLQMLQGQGNYISQAMSSISKINGGS